MKFILLRLAIVRFSSELRKWRALEWTIDSIRVESKTLVDAQKERTVLLIAHVPLDAPLEIDDNHLVMVPEVPRKRAETAIEAAANAVAVAEGCGRSIMSPLPCIAFIPASPEDRAWLDSTKGVAIGANFEGAMHTTLSPETMRSLADRVDGVALLAESLSHNHGAGKFRESLRVFERAFKRSSTGLVGPLTAFLAGARLGYTRDEVENWLVTLRHPATHADRRPELVLESHVRPVLARLQQATYDVLFNKARWRSPDVERREVWIPEQWTAGDGTLWILERTAPTLSIQLLDAFSAFPLNPSYRLGELPSDWWFQIPASYSVSVPHTVTRVPLRDAKS